MEEAKFALPSSQTCGLCQSECLSIACPKGQTVGECGLIGGRRNQAARKPVI